MSIQLPNLSYFIEEQTDIQEMNKIVKSAISNNDIKILEELIQQRISKPKYLESLLLRNELQEELKNINEKIKVANGTVKDINGKKITCYVDVREHSLNYRNIFESLSLLNKRIDDYRINTAYAVHSLSTLKDRIYENRIISEYISQCFGEWVENEKYEFNTAEWSQNNLDGLGGSDIHRVLKADPKNGAAHNKELKLRKLELDEDKEFIETPAIHIGNSWEKHILYTYVEKHPEKNIAISKTLWKGKDVAKSFYRAKFDGLELNDNGNPVSIIEIKTGTVSEDWGNAVEGIDGIPVKYRHQILWYAKNAKVNHAVLVAVLDDNDYREYHIDLNDKKLDEEWQNTVDKVQEFWSMILEERENLKNGINNFAPKPRKGFSKSLAKANIEKEAEKIAAYTDEDYYSILSQLEPILVNLRNQKIKDDKILQSIIQQELTNIYAQFDPTTRQKPLIGVDIETNGLSPKTSRIIETGIVVSHPTGELDIAYSSVHDIPEIVQEGIGIGEEKVHRINLNTIKGKPKFDSPEVQQKILELFKQGTIVAHNATFEKGYLIVNLPGFAEALDAGEIQILDTMNLASNIMTDSLNSKLQCFAEDNGVAYEGAHNATADTYMMMKALRNFQEVLFKHKQFIPQHISKESRQKSIQFGKEIDESR